jgi:hypothetical protein
VRKIIHFWQKRSPNCDFLVLHSPSTLSTSKNIDGIHEALLTSGNAFQKKGPHHFHQFFRAQVFQGLIEI